MDRIDAMRLFVRLAERGTFSAAARDLRVKQSTASKWVAELERQLGTSLVDRTTRSLRLTEAGRRFSARAVEVLAGFDGIYAELADGSAEPAGRVRASVPVVFGRRFVVPLVAGFLKRHPKVEAELVFNDRYVNLVEEGFDVAIRVGVPADTTARGRKLADSRRCLVAAPSYVKARGRLTAPKDLVEHDCLLHGEASAATIWRFRRAGAKDQPVPVRGRFAANNSEAVLEMARAGLGIALLADWLVTEDIERKRLIRLLEDHDTPPAPVYALTPPGRYTAAPVRALLDHLSTSLASRLGAPA